VRILIVGAGAVGGTLGARLDEAGEDVTFLVRPARAELLRAKGLELKSPLGDIHFAPKLLTADRLESSYDLIFLSVKSYALEPAMAALAPAFAEGSLILPVLNGLAHMDRLEERFGRRTVLGGACRISVQSKGALIEQTGSLQSIIIGDLDGKVPERVQTIAGLFQRAGFDATTSGHILHDLWEKWVQLATIGAVTCLLDGTIGAAAAVPGGSQTGHVILNEAAEIAAACGYPPSDTLLRSVSTLLNQADSTMTSSLYRDLKDGADVEVEAILQDLVDRGSRHGVAAPLLQAAASRLFVYRAGRMTQPH
jgi:2-dehydropantoate 2-reductase